MKVAILGASGVGKNHAGWFAGHGCELVSFLGSSPETVEQTASALRQNVGFAGRGYTDIDRLLAETRPEIVCISNPPQLHYELAKKCLRAGANVLCEKPLVGTDVEVGARPWQDIVAEGEELVTLARAEQRVFGTQMQYGHGARIFSEMAGLGDEPLLEWKMEFETKNVRRGRYGSQIWIDLSPHPLSILQKIRGPIEVDWSTAHCRIDEQESEARFVVRIAGQDEPCAAHIIVRCNKKRAAPLRCVSMNGRTVYYAARRSETGDFKSFFWNNVMNVEKPDPADALTYNYVAADEETVEEADLVNTLIGNFIGACKGETPLLVTGEDGVRNVEMQLRLMESR